MFDNKKVIQTKELFPKNKTKLEINFQMYHTSQHSYAKSNCNMVNIIEPSYSCRANSFTNSSCNNLADKFSNSIEYRQQFQSSPAYNSYDSFTYPSTVHQSYISNENEKLNQFLAYNQQQLQTPPPSSYFQSQTQFHQHHQFSAFATDSHTATTNHSNENHQTNSSIQEKKVKKSETSDQSHYANKNDAKINKAFGLKPKEKSDKSAKPNNNFSFVRDDDIFFLKI